MLAVWRANEGQRVDGGHSSLRRGSGHVLVIWIMVRTQVTPLLLWKEGAFPKLYSEISSLFVLCFQLN